MRICLISREYPPDTGWGGVGTYTYNHAHALKQLGHDVEVIALATQESVRTELPPAFDADGLVVHRAVWGPLLKKMPAVLISVPYTHYVLKSCVALWQKFLAVHSAKPFDVVEAPEHLAEALFPAITRICPLLIRLHTPHSKLVQERYHNLTDNFDHRLISILERVAMGQADTLSSPSLNLASYVSKDCGIDLKQIQILYNPVDTNKFTPDGTPAIPSDGHPTILFAGRLEERKGIQYLVEAIPLVLQRCPNARFIVVGADTKNGTTKTSMLSTLKRKLSTKNCLEAVQFKGYVPLEQMPSYYRSTDICVVPSLYENAPYTVLEAQASGRPVVGADSGGIPEYIAHGETGLIVAAQNPQALADAIVSLITDKEKRDAMGRAARARSIKDFGAPEIAKRALDSYNLAIQNFELKQTSPLYGRSPEKSLQDFFSLLYAYHNNLHELLYLHSIRFRIITLLKLMLNRPRFSMAKLMLGLSKKFHRIMPEKIQATAQNLEEKVETLEVERTDAFIRELLTAGEIKTTKLR